MIYFLLCFLKTKAVDINLQKYIVYYRPFWNKQFKTEYYPMYKILFTENEFECICLHASIPQAREFFYLLGHVKDELPPFAVPNGVIYFWICYLTSGSKYSNYILNMTLEGEKKGSFLIHALLNQVQILFNMTNGLWLQIHKKSLIFCSVLLLLFSQHLIYFWIWRFWFKCHWLVLHEVI